MPDRFSRLLRLIRLLQDARGRTVVELERMLEVDRRTIYRDLERLEDEGFPVEQKMESRRYFLANPEAADSFTSEEAALLVSALCALPQQDPLVQGLRQKLNSQQVLQPLQHQLRLAAMAGIVHALQQAIAHKEQVILENYLSARSNTCTNRLVEPIALEHHHSLLQAYEPASGFTKFFKVDRIGRLGYTGHAQRHRRQHKLQQTDAFGLAGSKAVETSLQLSTRAATLLREEYPAAEPYLTSNAANAQYPFQFKGPIRSWQGIGRFVLGLPGEVVVEGPEEFRGFLIRSVTELRSHFDEEVKV